MSKEKMQENLQEELQDGMQGKVSQPKKKKHIMIVLIAAICAFLGLGVWLLAALGGLNGGLPCVEDRCGGFYRNGICSKNDTHYEPARENDGYYEITNAGQFLWFGAKVNAGENKIKGRLVNDIDLDNYVWTPIGSSASPFGGTFDGCGYTINNLNVQGENICGGLFGYVTGIVRNFTVYGEITVAAQTTDKTVGQGLIGYASGAKIGKIESYVNIVAGPGSIEVGYVGGIVGDMGESTISQSIWYGTINMGEATVAAVGGIAGHVGDEGAVSIADCAGYGTIKSSVNGRPVMGGIVGYVNNDSAVLYNCIYAGKFELLKGARDTYVSAVGKLDAISAVTNGLYYLQDVALNAQLGDASLDEGVLTAVTAEDLSSGKVAWLLNGKAIGGLWKQTIGQDAYPNFKGEAVTINFGGTTPGEEITGDKEGEVPVYNNGVYEIYNEKQLFWFATKVNGGDNAINGKLMNDIDLKKQEWTAIGNGNSPYGGTFDGGGFTIKNLNLMAKAANEGFFGYVSGGTVKSFTICGDIVATKTQTKGEFSGLGVIGYATKATITEIQSCVTVSCNNDVTYLRYVGGIVGYQKSTNISKCIWWGYIDIGATQIDAVGGISGYNYGDGAGSITDCASYGTMESSYAGSLNLSGIIGYINNPNVVVKDCIFAGRFRIGEGTRDVNISAVGYVRNVSELSNVYYENGSAPNVRKGEAVLAENAITAVTADDLKSNAAVKLLNGNRANAVWEQYNDPAYPAFAGMTPPDGYPARYVAAVYQITNADQLFEFAAKVNAGETDIHAKLMKDIDLNNKEWTPIGNLDNPYKGTFDGAGFSIWGLNVDAETPYEGLFGYVLGGTVKDFTVYGKMNIVKTQVEGEYSGLGVIGYADKATISGIYSCLNIGVAEDVSYFRYVGGIVAGQNASAISKCIWWGSIDMATTKTDLIGGIVGYGGGGESSITDCASYGTFKSNISGSVGISGILGYVNNENMTVSNCLFAGRFDLSKNTKTGSIYAIGNFKKVKEVSNVYYEKDSAPNVKGGAATLADDAIAELEKGKLKSGEAAAYLNGNRSNAVWEQLDGSQFPTIVGRRAPEGYPVRIVVVKDYEIHNADQLFEFAAKVSAGETDINAKLMADIDLDNRAWTPIGNEAVPFTGTFDGNGKTITNLNVETSAEQNHAGLFGTVEGGTVKNLTVKGDMKINASSLNGNLGVIGCATKNATVSGIESHVNITVGEGVISYQYVGGIVGNLTEGSKAEKCIWYGMIDEGTCNINRFAGIAGRIGAATVSNCASYGTLKSSNTSGDIQGVVGWVDNAYASISNCLFAGTVECAENATMGVTAIADMGGSCDESKFSNLYYLNIYVKGIDNDKYSAKATAVTETQLKTGEVVWLLNGSKEPGVWKQSSSEELPNFKGTDVPSEGYNSGETSEQDAAELVDGVYQITNASQLFWFAEKVKAGENSINGKLMADIDLDNRAWTPIGNEAVPFTGTFDGNGKTITNLNVKTSAEQNHAGLFGTVEGGTVKNLTVKGDMKITASSLNGNLGVIGCATKNATVSGIESHVNITVGEGVISYQYVGGIVGNLTEGSKAEKCIWYGMIDEGTCNIDRFAGIAGRIGAATVNNCASYGTLKSSNTSGDIQGVVGWVNNADASISNCLFAGTVKCAENANMGVTAIADMGGSCDASKFSDLYYLETYAKGIDNDKYSNKATAVTEEDLKSGKVAWLLNGKTDEGEPLWRQDEEAALPSFTGAIVKSDKFSDSPSDDSFAGEFDEDGFAVLYQPAKLVNGVYQIENAGQLFWFAAKVNSGANDIDGILMKDIDLGNRAWTPIGNEDMPFTGTFDGNGKTITNLKVETSAEQDHAGLFGTVEGGTVKNLTVKGDMKITASSLNGNLGVIGCATKNATVSGIESHVNITVGEGVISYQYVGGIVGNLTEGSKAEKCIWYGMIDEGTCNIDRFAGIAGRIGAATVSNCASYGTLKSSNTSGDIQGVVGWVNNADASISNCLFAGTVECAENATMGVTAIADMGGSCDASKFSDLYYLNIYVKGIDNDKYSAKATAVTETQLKTGEVVWLLNGSKEPGVWKQSSSEELPNFKGTDVPSEGYKICAVQGCDGTYGDNGICSADATHYQEPELVDGVYEISNAGQLFWFAEKVNAGEYSINGKLMADIDLENREWTPIGNFDGVANASTQTAYKGAFDGNGKTISGLKLTTTDKNSNVGLFGLVIGGKIQNFTVNGEIQIAVDDTDGRIGVIGQCFETTVSGIESSVNITGADGATSKYAGGVVGDIMNNSTVEKCVWYGAIDAGKCKIVCFGGIVGRTGPSTITNCASYGTLQGTTSNNIHLHGIVGWANNANMIISNCLFAGKVDASGSFATAVANVGTNCKDIVNTVLNNVYYAEDSATKIALYNGKDGTGSTVYDTLQQKLAATVTGLTEEQLSDGTAVLRLNGDAADGVWMLDTFTINGAEYKLPGFDGELITGVCNETGCQGTYINGICSANDAHYQAAVYNETDSVYEISNGGQLFSFAAMVNAGNSGVTRFKAKLTKDINLDNHPWTPIGTEANPFVGTFDGNGKTISGLNLTTTGAAHEGLFGYVTSSTVKNFTVDGVVTINVSKTENEGNLGVIGYAGSGTVIQNITSHVEVAVNDAVTNGKLQYVGGIVGNFDSGLLEKCIWDGVIDEGYWTINRFAGIAGRMGGSASITNSASYGTLKSKNAKADLAGIVGWANNPGGIRNSLFAGELLYEGTGSVNYTAIASVGSSCTADKLTGLYYVNDTGYVAGKPDTVFSNAEAVTRDEAFSRSMVWKLNGKKKTGNWRYNTGNQRPEFEGEFVTSE